MAQRTAFVNARLLDPARGLDAPGAVLIENKEILAVGPAVDREGAAVIDCGGHCLAPGLVDSRVHLREPGFAHQETIETGTRAAAAGGVTAMIGLPNTRPVIDDDALVESVARKAREAASTKIFCYGALTKGLKGEELTEMGLLAEAGAVGFTDADRAVATANVMRRALAYSRTFDALIIQHAEEASLCTCAVMNAGETATQLGLIGAPTAAEVIVIERDLRLVEMTGARYHVANLTCAESIEVVRRAKARGLRVTAGTAPHYFTLDETAVGDYLTFAKVSPPLRSASDRQAVIDGLADGTIDVVASDHAPYDQDSKRRPFAIASSGIIGLETLLPLTLGLHFRHGLPLLEVLARITVNPARLTGLPLGRLEAGAAADLVLFDPNAEYPLDPARLHSKSKNTPFSGHPMRGRVLRTVVDGRTVFARDGEGGGAPTA